MRTNLAARAGRWSAQHRRKAIIGWFVFVILAFVVGGAVGRQTLSEVDSGNGESQRADRAIEGADFPEYAEEQILIQGRSAIVRDRAARAAVSDVVARLGRVPHVSDVQSPLTISNPGQISSDGRSALVTFKLAGDDDLAQKRVDAALAATAAAQRAHPTVRVEEFGDASANKAIMESVSADFQKAEITSVPVTLVILLIAFGSLVAAGSRSCWD